MFSDDTTLVLFSLKANSCFLCSSICVAAVVYHLFIFLCVPHLHLTPQVPKAGQDQDVTLRTENRKDDTVRSNMSPAMPLIHHEDQRKLAESADS